MTSDEMRTDVECLRALIVQRIGLQLEDSSLEPLRELSRKSNGPGVRWTEPELSRLAEEVTVAETYFFRHMEQFRVLGDLAIPGLLKACERRRPVRILSAGCSTGEETYSIAMTIDERLPGLSRNELEITGVDVAPSRIARARSARYPRWSFRETPERVKASRFEKSGDEFCLAEGIRDMVDYRVSNLAERDSPLWAASRYDVVFCRNVLMYFSPSQARDLVGRITGALVPGGYLFLGHAETLRGLTDDYHLQQAQGAFYYVRKSAGDRSASACHDGSLAGARAIRLALDALPESDGSWVELIHRASTRIQALSEKRCANDDSETLGQTAPAGRESLAPAMELLRSERYQEGLACVTALAQEFDADPDVLLLRAVLLVHVGNLDEAEEVCRHLMRIDELHPGAHYVMALCKEAIGDGMKAAEHDRVAAHLDPCFAMPRLHLGLLARRGGDQSVVRRELGQALTLLQSETPARLLLFGGGFGREALVALCRAGLTASGGRP